MRVISLWLITAFIGCIKALNDKKIVCYYNSTAIYRPGKGQFMVHYINPKLCTHLVYSYAGLTITGEVKSLDPGADLPDNEGKDGYGEFYRLRFQNNQIRTFIAIGGQNQSSAVYSVVAADPSKRRIFIENAIKFVKNYRFDGMSFDWQYPNQRGGVPADRENYIQLLKELREGFDRAGLLLMATVAASYQSADRSYIIPEMVKYIDTINLMTFDFHGYWDSKTGFNSPLFPRQGEVGFEKYLNVNETLNYWLKQGAPAHKLIMGIPAHGSSFTLRNPLINNDGALIIGPGQAGAYTHRPGFLGHNEIVEILLNNHTRVYDSDRKALYAFSGDQWFSYEHDLSFDFMTIGSKAKVIKNLGLGGAMLYNIDTDDFLGISGIKYPLLDAINLELRDYVPPELPSTTTTTTITQASTMTSSSSTTQSLPTVSTTTTRFPSTSPTVMTTKPSASTSTTNTIPSTFTTAITTVSASTETTITTTNIPSSQSTSVTTQSPSTMSSTTQPPSSLSTTSTSTITSPSTTQTSSTSSTRPPSSVTTTSTSTITSPSTTQSSSTSSTRPPSSVSTISTSEMTSTSTSRSPSTSSTRPPSSVSTISTSAMTSTSTPRSPSTMSSTRQPPSTVSTTSTPSTSSPTETTTSKVSTTGQTSTTEINPCDLVCRETGYLRDPVDCKIYYRCVYDYRQGRYLQYQFSCPLNLVFDLVINVCNYRPLVNCKGCKL